MKRFLSLVLCIILVLTSCAFQIGAIDEKTFIPYIVDFSLTSPVYGNTVDSNNSRATGLILSYYLGVSVSGTTLKINAETYCIADVVKCGFKNLVVQRKKTTSAIWSDYYDFGDLYIDSYMANLSTSLAVGSGYQYRLSCKHYAKKSLLSTQNISNTSNVVAV